MMTSARGPAIALLLAGHSAVCARGAPVAEVPPAVSAEPALIGGFWLQAVPGDLDEAAVRQAVAGRGSSELALTELDALSARARGTQAAGLAELAAGLLLLDAGRPVEAIPRLQHTDIRHTSLRDYASLAFG